MVTAIKLSAFVPVMMVAAVFGVVSTAPLLAQEQFATSERTVTAQPGTTPSVRAQAASFKAQGDELVAGDQLGEAAEAYAQALSLARDAFTPDERVEMAIYISWEDRLEEASRELEMVLAEHPDHIGARAHLARVYSWSGQLGESVVEADTVLEASPGNRDALLVKADALEWQGRFRKAIPVYEEILESGEDFDAGLGLSYALLSGGNRSRARENARQLLPANTRQSIQLDELNQTIRDTSRPRVEVGDTYYEDSDENQHHRYSLLYGFGLGNSDFELSLTRTDSRNDTGTSRSRSAGLGFNTVLTEGVSIGAGVGVTEPGTGSRPKLMTGSFTFTSSVSNGTISGNLSSAVLADTTELIDNRIRADRYELTVAKPLAGRLSASGGYGFRNFSDGNHAHDVQVSPEFLLLDAPKWTLGYQFRFQDYASQTFGGYFDPNDYLAHRVFSSLYYETRRFYTYVNAFAGNQSYSRNGFATDDTVLGGALSLGFTPASAISIEINAEGGNFAAGTVSGFRYFNLGSRVTIGF